MQAVKAWVSSWFSVSSVRTLSKGAFHGGFETPESKAIARALFAYDPSFDMVDEIAQKVIQLQSQGRDVYFKRNGTSYVKPIVLANKSAFFLLPVKNAKYDSFGADKYGRRALYCWLDDGVWKVERVWNLTSRKIDGQHLSMFTKARQIENKIPENVLQKLAPRLLYDFDVQGCINKRCAFYSYYRCLNDVLNATLFDTDPQKYLAIIRSVACKLALLHKAGFSWRDLKPDNILVDTDNSVRFCDLDSCTELLVEPAGSKPGTILYMPPEMLNNLPTNNKKRDVFAFGCILYEIINNFQPEKTFPSVQTSHVIGEFSTIKEALEGISAQARSFDPNLRPDMQTISNLLMRDYPHF